MQMKMKTKDKNGTLPAGLPVASEFVQFSSYAYGLLFRAFPCGLYVIKHNILNKCSLTFLIIVGIIVYGSFCKI